MDLQAETQLVQLPQDQGMNLCLGKWEMHLIASMWNTPFWGEDAYLTPISFGGSLYEPLLGRNSMHGPF